MNPDTRIYISGHRGMVGSSMVRTLEKNGYRNLLLADRAELDLTDQQSVFDFFSENRPECQIICAAKVGGIKANNDYPADYICKNLMIQSNLIEAARLHRCRENLFVSSSCIYPRNTPQPMKEESLLTGPLEPTNQWYAVAKMAGIKMGQAYKRQFGLSFISVLPANLYGLGDNFHPLNSHVLPAIMRRLHEAKQANKPTEEIWGSGKARREFMHVDDLTSAVFHLLTTEHKVPEIVNIGSGKDWSIAEAAQVMKQVVGFEGELEFDTSKLEGPPQKLLDNSIMDRLGWKPHIDLKEGLTQTYEWFTQHQDQLRGVHPSS